MGVIKCLTATDKPEVDTLESSLLELLDPAMDGLVDRSMRPVICMCRQMSVGHRLGWRLGRGELTFEGPETRNAIFSRSPFLNACDSERDFYESNTKQL